MSTPSQLDPVALRDILGTRIHVTDMELALLAPIDKVKILHALVHEAVEKMQGINLTWDEKVLVFMYREWRSSPKSASGVFHARVPTNFNKFKHELEGRLKSEPAASGPAHESDIKATCDLCDKPIHSSDYYLVDSFGVYRHADCFHDMILKEAKEDDNPIEQQPISAGDDTDLHGQTD